MIVVSRTPDVRRIQGEIADCLHLKLEEESDTARANQICLRIKNVEKILIILDDVWKDVNLEAIGIPSCDDHRGCNAFDYTKCAYMQFIALSKENSTKFLSGGRVTGFDEKNCYSW